MRRHLVAVLAVVPLAACSSSGGGAATPPASVTSSAGSSAAATGSAHVGDTLTLSTGLSGGALQVTAVKVERVHPKQTIDPLSRGNQWVGVQLRLAAPSAAVNGEGPFISTTVLDNNSESYQPAAVETLREGAALPGMPHVSPGSSVLGWIVFQIPKSRVVARVQYAAGGGLGDTGEWLVP